MPRMPVLLADPFRQLEALMASYPCYAFVRDGDGPDARALFRGRWGWDAVSAHFAGTATRAVIDDERASGYMRFRLYGAGETAGCLAEIEVYFSRGDGRTSFWCAADDAGARLALAA